MMEELSLSLGHLLPKLESHKSSFFPVAKSRAIAIPVDLDSQVNNLFLKSHNIVQKTAMNWRLTARNAARRDSVLAASRDYRNIIERLQVMPDPERSEPEPGLRWFPHSSASMSQRKTKMDHREMLACEWIVKHRNRHRTENAKLLGKWKAPHKVMDSKGS